MLAVAATVVLGATVVPTTIVAAPLAAVAVATIVGFCAVPATIVALPDVAFAMPAIVPAVAPTIVRTETVAVPAIAANPPAAAKVGAPKPAVKGVGNVTAGDKTAGPEKLWYGDEGEHGRGDGEAECGGREDDWRRTGDRNNVRRRADHDRRRHRSAYQVGGGWW